MTSSKPSTKDKKDEDIASVNLRRDELDAVAQHCMQSLKFRDPILKLFRTACGYGTSLAEGRLSCSQFTQMCVNTHICPPRRETVNVKTVLDDVLQSTYERDNGDDGDLRNEVIHYGIDGVENEAEAPPPPPPKKPTVDTSYDPKAHNPLASTADDDERAELMRRRVENDKALDEEERSALYKPVWTRAERQFEELAPTSFGAGHNVRVMENSVAMSKLVQVADYEVTDLEHLRQLFKAGKSKMSEEDLRHMYYFVVPESQGANLQNFAMILLGITEKLFPEEFHINHESALLLLLAFHMMPYVKDMTPQTYEDILTLRPIAKVPHVGTLLRKYEPALGRLFIRYACNHIEDKEAMPVDAFFEIMQGIGVLGVRMNHESIYNILRLYEGTHGEKYSALGIVLTEHQFHESLILVAFMMFNDENTKDVLPTVASRFQCLMDMWPEYYEVIMNHPMSRDVRMEDVAVPSIALVEPSKGDTAGSTEVTIHGTHIHRKCGGIVRFGSLTAVAHVVREETLRVYTPECLETSAFDVSVFLREGAIHGEVILKHTVDVRVTNDGELFSEVHAAATYTFEDRKPSFSLIDIQSKLLRMFSAYCHLEDRYNTKHLHRPQWMQLLRGFSLYDPMTADAVAVRRGGSKEDTSKALEYFERCSCEVDSGNGTRALRYKGFIRALCLCFVYLKKNPYEGLRDMTSTDAWIGRELLSDVEVLRKGEFSEKLRHITNSFGAMQSIEHVPHCCTPRDVDVPDEVGFGEDALGPDHDIVGKGMIINLGDMDGMYMHYLASNHNDELVSIAESDLFKTWAATTSLDARKRGDDKNSEFALPTDASKRILVPNDDGIDPRDSLIITRQHVSALLRGTQRDQSNRLLRHVEHEQQRSLTRLGNMSMALAAKDAEISALKKEIEEFKSDERRRILDEATMQHGVLRSEKELLQVAFTQQLEMKKYHLEAAMLAQEAARDEERDKIVAGYKEQLGIANAGMNEMQQALDEQSLFLVKQSTVMEAMNVRMRILQAENTHLKGSQEDLLRMIARDKNPERYSDWVQKNAAHKERVDTMLKKLHTVVNSAGNEGVRDVINLPPPPKTRISSWDKVEATAVLKMTDKETKQQLGKTDSKGRFVRTDDTDGTAPTSPTSPTSALRKKSLSKSTQCGLTVRFANADNDDHGDNDNDLEGRDEQSAISDSQTRSHHPLRSPVVPQPLPVVTEGMGPDDIRNMFETSNQSLCQRLDDDSRLWKDRIDALEGKMQYLFSNVEKIKDAKGMPPGSAVTMRGRRKSTATKPPGSRGSGVTPPGDKALDGMIMAAMGPIRVTSEEASTRIETLVSEFRQREIEFEAETKRLALQLDEATGSAEEGHVLYRPKPNETLIDVASNLGCRLQDLLDATGLPSPAIPASHKFVSVPQSMIGVIPRNRPDSVDVEFDPMEAAIMEYARMYRPGMSVRPHLVQHNDTVEGICEMYNIHRDDLLRANFIPLNTEDTDLVIQGMATKHLRIPQFPDQDRIGSPRRQSALDPFTRLEIGTQMTPPNSGLEDLFDDTLHSHATSTSLRLTKPKRPSSSHAVDDDPAMQNPTAKKEEQKDDDEDDEGEDSPGSSVSSINPVTKPSRDSSRRMTTKTRPGRKKLRPMIADLKASAATLREEMKKLRALFRHEASRFMLGLRRAAGIVPELPVTPRGLGRRRTSVLSKNSASVLSNQRRQTEALNSSSNHNMSFVGSDTFTEGADSPVQRPNIVKGRPSLAFVNLFEASDSDSDEEGLFIGLRSQARHRVNQTLVPSGELQPVIPPPYQSGGGLPIMVGTAIPMIEQHHMTEAQRQGQRRRLYDAEMLQRGMIMKEEEVAWDRFLVAENRDRPHARTHHEIRTAADLQEHKKEVLQARDRVLQQLKDARERVKAHNDEQERRQQAYREVRMASLDCMHKAAAAKRQARVDARRTLRPFDGRRSASPASEALNPSLPQQDTSEPSNDNKEERQGQDKVSNVKFLEPLKKPSQAPEDQISQTLPPQLQQQLRAMQAVEATLKSMPQSTERTRVLQERYSGTLLRYLHRRPDEAFTESEQREIEDMHSFLSTHRTPAMMECLEASAASQSNGWNPMTRLGGHKGGPPPRFNEPLLPFMTVNTKPSK